MHEDVEVKDPAWHTNIVYTLYNRVQYIFEDQYLLAMTVTIVVAATSFAPAEIAWTSRHLPDFLMADDHQENLCSRKRHNPQSHGRVA